MHHLKLLCILWNIFVDIEASFDINNEKAMLRSDISLTPPYFNLLNSDYGWKSSGSTISTNDYIRLTSEIASQKGSIWLMKPIDFNSWEIHIHLKVHGVNNKYFGDGLAFWYTKTPVLSGNAFGSLETFSGLGIFFDTYGNRGDTYGPEIIIDVNDGKHSYSNDQDGKDHKIGGCVWPFRDNYNDIHVRVSYDADLKHLNVEVMKNNNKYQCASLNGVILPTRNFFGLSSATGDLVDNHDIYSVRIYQLSSTQNNNRDHLIPSSSNNVDGNYDASLNAEQHPVSSSSSSSSSSNNQEQTKNFKSSSERQGWRKMLTVVVGIAILVGLIFAIQQFISYRKKRHMKRLY